MKSIMKARRRKLNITLHELSDLTGVSKSFLSQIENAKDNCPVWLMEKIAEVLRCKSDTVFKPVVERKTRYVVRRARR